MARPHPALLHLAAGRPMPRIPPDEVDALLRSAFEHRVNGLLLTRVTRGEVTLPPLAVRTLAKADLRSAAHNSRLWQVLDEVQSRLADIGVQIAAAKGITAEARWYTRTGERPCRDLDVMVDPAAQHRITDVIRALDPNHFLLGTVDKLVGTGMLQSVDVRVSGVELDLHVDLLKFEIPTRQATTMWTRTECVTAPMSHHNVRALDAEMSLVHFLLHLNKDAFARLLGYVDVAKILAAGPLDWRFIDRFLAIEGLRVHVYSALHTVVEQLHLPEPPVPAPRGATAVLWRRLWPQSAALLGSRLAWTQNVHRQLWIPWTATGRTAEAAQWWIRRRLLPPSMLLDIYYPTVSGPYLWRLTKGRLAVLRGRRARAAALRADEATW